MRGTIVSVESPSRGCLLPPVTVLSSSQQANCYANFPKLQTRAEKCKLTKINFPNWSNIGSSSSCWNSPSACSGTVCKNGQDVDRWHSMKRNARQKFPENFTVCRVKPVGESQRYKPLANKDHQNLQHHIMRWKNQSGRILWKILWGIRGMKRVYLDRVFEDVEDKFNASKTKAKQAQKTLRTIFHCSRWNSAVYNQDLAVWEKDSKLISFITETWASGPWILACQVVSLSRRSACTPSPGRQNMMRCRFDDCQSMILKDA